ncbi:MAG: hypothetical protein K2K06_12010 [Oscillospiraceae bacterium]|nr:hypothetical protein [Oscillospiraceae bacterium]
MPTIETIRKQDCGTWRNKIKKPLEKALNELLAKDIISEWEYKHKTDSLLSDEDHKMTFEEWSDSMIYFACIDDTKPQSNADRKESS